MSRAKSSKGLSILNVAVNHFNFNEITVTAYKANWSKRMLTFSPVITYIEETESFEGKCKISRDLYFIGQATVKCDLVKDYRRVGSIELREKF